MQPPVRHFAIITFRKAGRMRYLSHLDLARTMDLAVRRAGLPVKYSEGYNPRAQIGFSDALPVGVGGERELAQIELTEPIAPDTVFRTLAEQLPEGLELVEAEVVSSQKKKHVSGKERADYEIELGPGTVDTAVLERAAESVMNAGTLHIVRETTSRTREVDIRPGIHDLTVLAPTADDAGPRLRMSLALRQQELVKPLEVLEVMKDALARIDDREHDLDVRRITRLRVY